ncbi:DUF4179 domain-containing protein [Paenibacillus sp. J2TS4]|uniref:DUF4179 domain-containing protein n=1 Tax=Paenibacillus sp. J2TS4 TaxID=2807194 RepID=UPI001B1ACCBD|nr:DUF4179 domain-containing protein [Paenibacillus sp. J2TS4]GIP33411.1 hypothetical protein J2TS4_26210 [Paenibacillus sp. J2TS4]
MNNIEERLADEKKRTDSITAPEELEQRLRSALESTPPKRTKRIAPIWKITAVSLLFMITVGYHYNGFAFYGKKLLGFDEVMDGTLKERNEEGMGQIIEKQTELHDGTILTINGIMTDANQLVMYYTLSNPNGIDESQGDLFRPSEITGFLTSSRAVSGTSLINENQTEIKGMKSFEPVSPFSKKLTLHYWQQLEDGQMTEENLSFPYNPNQAMQTVIKQSIKKTIKVDKGSVTFDSITATPTLTVVEGTLNVKNFDRIDFPLEGVELIANGTPVQLMGGGSQSLFGGGGFKFDIRYDVLPEQLESLELVVQTFVGYQKLDAKLALASIGDEPISLDGKELWVKDVSTTSQGVEITIATENDVMLDGVSIETPSGIIPLKTTINQFQTSQEDGRQWKERTLLFDTTTEPESLLIEGMHYRKAYNDVMKISVD